MDMLKRINKGVGAAATAMIIVGGTPMVVQAMPNNTDIPKIEAKAICQDIEKSIKNGTYKVDDLNKNLYSNMNKSSQKQENNNKKDEIKVKVLQDKSDTDSMAEGYIEKVEHEVLNGKHYIILSLDSIDWMSNITAAIDGGAEKKVSIIENKDKKSDDGKGKQTGKIKFEIKDLNSKILMHMNVKPMGNARVAFRLVPEVTSNDQVKPKKEDTQAKDNNKDKEKDNQKPKEDIKQTGDKNKDTKKDKTDKKSEIKWGKVINISEITSVELGKFYGDFEKYRINFKKASYDPSMAIYIKNFQGVEVNGVKYSKADSVEKKGTFYFSAMGLELNPSAFNEGKNTLVFKSKGHNDLRAELNKNGQTIKVTKQEEGIRINTETGSEVSGKPQHNIADGIYTVGFKATKVDNFNDSSMLGGFLDPNVKVQVKDGKIKLTLLHKVMADMLIDVRFESNGKYIPAKLTYYNSPKGKTVDRMKTVEVEVSDLSNPHNCAVLVTGMGGKLIDIGHMDRYKVAKLTFNDELVEGWKGFEEKREVKTSDQLFNEALISAHLDKDRDGIVTDEELALASYEIQLNSKRLKDITRLKNLGSKVTSLDLRANEISEVKEGTFDNAVNLEKLLLSCNEITSLSSNIFDKLTNLKTLDISENNLKNLPKELFKNLKNLEELSIRQCNLEELPEGIFKNLKKLKTLSLVGNKLSHIPKAIFDLDNLQYLYISENMLEDIPQELSNLKKLKAIHADHNFINKIDNKFFDNIRKNNNVKTLNLKDNELKEFPKDMDKIFNLNSFGNEMMLNNIKNVPKFKDGVLKKVYPQKSSTNFKAEVKDNKITWKSDLSILDILCWQRAVDRNLKVINTVEEYREYLKSKGAKTAEDVLKKEGLMWDIVTDVQKKNSNGKYETIKTFKSKEDTNVGSYDNSSIDGKNQYRILKRVYGANYEAFSYLLGQMAEVKVASENASKEVVQDKIKDGIYNVGFTAYKVEDRNETSMLNNFFDKKAKLEVKDGKMKITLLNICFADGIYDFRIESNGEFCESGAKGYGKLDHNGKYPFKTFEVNISDIGSEHEGCVLVGPMGGLISDIGNFDKYKKVMFVFDKNNLKEWNGFDEDHKKVDDDKEFNKALLDANLDKDGDGIVTNEELALAEGEVKLARKGIKDISRLKFLGKNVTALDLTGNKITELPEGAFNNLTKLKKLDIHGNYIKKLPNGIFDKLTELTDLHIGMNEFKELPQGIFDRLTKLKELSIYNMHTPLIKIDDNAFSNLKNLEYLSLEETGISKIPQGIFNLTNLNMLNLSKNQLKTIPKELANLKNLTWLDLGTNYIEEIPDEVYKNLNKLTMFQIKDNQLTKIPLNIWDLIPKSKTLDCSLNKLAVTPKLPDPSKGKRWFTAYPQKQALKLELSANDRQVKWNQELSALDIIAWFKIAGENQFNGKKIPQNVNEYKEQLGKKTVLEFLKEKDSEPKIVTQIQKKEKDGTYKTIKEIVKFNEQDSGSSYIDSDMKNGDEYRILKKSYVISYSYEYYIFTDVAYAKATANVNNNQNPQNEDKLLINIEKPAVYEGKIDFDNKENKENEKIAAKYVDVEQKINVEVKDKQAYMIIKLKGKQEYIKDIKVNGQEEKFEVIGEEIGKVNRLAATNAVMAPKVQESKESTTIRFKVPNEKAKIEITMNGGTEDKDETFVLKLKEIKEVKDNLKPQVTPSTNTGTSHNHSHKHKKHKKDSKEDSSEQVKDNKEDKKDDTTASKDTNVKEDGNSDVKPNTDVKDNNKKEDSSKDNKDAKEDKKDSNDSKKKDSGESKDKNVENKQDNSKEVKTEGKKEQNKDKKQPSKVTSKTNLSSGENIENASTKKATKIKEKNLPQTGMPFGGGLLATIGSAISGIGIVLGRKNKKNKK